MTEVERAHQHIRQLEEAIADKEAEISTMMSPGFFGQKETGVAGDGGLMPRPQTLLGAEDHASPISLSTWITGGSQRSRRSSPWGKPPAKEPPSNKPFSRPRAQLKDKTPATGRVTQAPRQRTNGAWVERKHNDNHRAE